VIGNLTPTGVPLAAGIRVIYEHDSALWSAPESGPGIGQQLTPANIQVSAVWSVAPDGGTVAYAEVGTGRIHIIRSDGQSNIASGSFSGLCTTSALCADHTPTLAWSPDGRYIAYQAIDGTLHVVNADGTNDPSLSSSKQGIATSLLWSSDSNQLAFVEVAGTGESIFSFNFSTGRLIQVAASIDPANSASIVQKMFWLPDKGHPALTWTAWDAADHSLTGIFSGDLAGRSVAKRLTPTNLQVTAAGFTPTQGNGIWLVAATNQNGVPEIGTVAAGQSSLDVTNAGPVPVITGIYWSPLGDTAALVSSSGQMVLGSHNGASLSQPDLTVSDVTGAPIWSPDGTHLIAKIDQVIFSLGVDNGSFTLPNPLPQVVQTPTSVTMLWSPDSQNIAIASPSGTYLASSDGKKVKQIDTQTATGLFVWSVAG
jgi:WD40 repeat protein